MNKLYKLFLAFNSTYLIIVVYLINKNFVLILLANKPNYYSHLIFVLIPVLLTLLSFLLLNFLDDDEIKKENILEVELANNTFLPTYLGYFFVSLSISNLETLIFIFLIIYVFTFLSQTLYFNPIFLLFRYNFYFLTNSDNVKIFLITKRQIKYPKEFDFNRLKRINDYTFIDTQKKHL
jgi:hypothetical protein